MARFRLVYGKSSKILIKIVPNCKIGCRNSLLERLPVLPFWGTVPLFIIGMTPEETRNVFGRQFERGEEAKKVYALGRGIGLFIAANIIKEHKGKIWVESPGPGKGSSFYVELPAR